MIIVKTFKEESKVYIDHGVDSDTLRTVALPSVLISSVDWVEFNSIIGEFVLKEK